MDLIEKCHKLEIDLQHLYRDIQEIMYLLEKIQELQITIEHLCRDVNEIKQKQSNSGVSFILKRPKLVSLLCGFLVFMACETGRYLVSLDPHDISNPIVRFLYKY